MSNTKITTHRISLPPLQEIYENVSKTFVQATEEHLAKIKDAVFEFYTGYARYNKVFTLASDDNYNRTPVTLNGYRMFYTTNNDDLILYFDMNTIIDCRKLHYSGKPFTVFRDYLTGKFQCRKDRIVYLPYTIEGFEVVDAKMQSLQLNNPLEIPQLVDSNKIEMPSTVPVVPTVISNSQQAPPFTTQMQGGVPKLTTMMAGVVQTLEGAVGSHYYKIKLTSVDPSSAVETPIFILRYEDCINPYMKFYQSLHQYYSGSVRIRIRMISAVTYIGEVYIGFYYGDKPDKEITVNDLLQYNATSMNMSALAETDFVFEPISDRLYYFPCDPKSDAERPDTNVRLVCIQGSKLKNTYPTDAIETTFEILSRPQTWSCFRFTLPKPINPTSLAWLEGKSFSDILKELDLNSQEINFVSSGQTQPSPIRAQVYGKMPKLFYQYQLRSQYGMIYPYKGYKDNPILFGPTAFVAPGATGNPEPNFWIKERNAVTKKDKEGKDRVYHRISIIGYYLFLDGDRELFDCPQEMTDYIKNNFLVSEQFCSYKPKIPIGYDDKTSTYYLPPPNYQLYDLPNCVQFLLPTLKLTFDDSVYAQEESRKDVIINETFEARLFVQREAKLIHDNSIAQPCILMLSGDFLLDVDEYDLLLKPTTISNNSIFTVNFSNFQLNAVSERGALGVLPNNYTPICFTTDTQFASVSNLLQMPVVNFNVGTNSKLIAYFKGILGNNAYLDFSLKSQLTGGVVANIRFDGDNFFIKTRSRYARTDNIANTVINNANYSQSGTFIDTTFIHLLDLTFTSVNAKMQGNALAAEVALGFVGGGAGGATNALFAGQNLELNRQRLAQQQQQFESMIENSRYLQSNALDFQSEQNYLTREQQLRLQQNNQNFQLSLFGAGNQASTFNNIPLDYSNFERGSVLNANNDNQSIASTATSSSDSSFGVPYSRLPESGISTPDNSSISSLSSNGSPGIAEAINRQNQAMRIRSVNAAMDNISSVETPAVQTQNTPPKTAENIQPTTTVGETNDSIIPDIVGSQQRKEVAKNIITAIV